MFMTQARQRTMFVTQPAPDPNYRYGGFQSLDELLHPALRPEDSVNTVKKLIRYKFKQLTQKVNEHLQRSGTCHVYFPWSQQGWAFALFQPSDDVKKFMTTRALKFRERTLQVPNVTVHFNVFNRHDPQTDFKVLAQNLNNVLVFGDNTTGRGRGNAAAIRGLPNAIGIPTGWNDSFGVWTIEMEVSKQVEESMKTREQGFMAREQVLVAREQVLVAREKAIRAREVKLLKREKAVEAREIGLARKKVSRARVKATKAARGNKSVSMVEF